MRIKEIISRSRRDFTAVYECEHCGHEQESYGYDDSNFHETVIPNLSCGGCGKIAEDSYVPMKPMYPPGKVV